MSQVIISFGYRRFAQQEKQGLPVWWYLQYFRNVPEKRKSSDWKYCTANITHTTGNSELDN